MSITIRRALAIAAVLGFVLAFMPAMSTAYADAEPPAKVEMTTLKVTAQPSATVGWKRVDGAAGYKIYRNGKAIGNVKENEGITKDRLYYVDQSLAPGETYRYAVKAYVMDGETSVYGGSGTVQRIDGGYTYEKQDDGEMTLTGYTGREESLNVPTEIAGGTVTEVGDECYRGNVWIKKITVPEGITDIGDYGFEACSAAKKVFLPNSLKTIGDGAFSGCGQLALLDMQDGVTEIGDGAFLCCLRLPSMIMPKDLKKLGKFVFGGCESLGSVDFNGAEIDALPDRTFCNCSKLTSVVLPETLKTIGKRAFFGCGHLYGITLPNSMESVADYAFEGCLHVAFEYNGDSLVLGHDVFSTQRGMTERLPEMHFFTLYKGMKVQEGSLATAEYNGVNDYTFGGSPNYEIVDGSLYSGDGKTLLAYFPYDFDLQEYVMKKTAEAEQQVFTVKEGVTRIAPYAFYHCGLKKVTLPSSIREIPADAFAGSGLNAEKVEIPEGADVTIDENAFDQSGDNEDDPFPDWDWSDLYPDDDYDPDVYITAKETSLESLAGDRNLYDPADYAGYLDINDDDCFEEWVQKYIEYNKDTVPMTAEVMPYITMYTGESHYRQMTSVLNHDVYKTQQSIARSGDDYQEMYLMMDHGVFAELSRGRMCDDLVLYSGITNERCSDIAGIDRSIMPTDEQLLGAIGNTVLDEAVMSTTGRVSTAFSFGDYAKAIVIIYASQQAMEELGTICVDEFSLVSGEHEILFNANARYKVLDSGHARLQTYKIHKETGEKILFDESEEYKYVRLKLLTESEAEAEHMDGTETMSEPVYEWAPDHSSVTGTIVCSDDGDVLTETAETAYEVIQKPTADKPGIGRYTARFKNSCFETQVCDVELTLTPEEIEAAEAAKSALTDLVLMVKDIDAGKYTSESFQALKDAVDDANEAIDDPAATAEEVKAAQAALLAAWRTLEPIDVTAEAEAKERGDAVNALAEALIDIYENLDTSLYKPASVTALQEKIDAAEAVLADAASDTDALHTAKTELLKARKALVKRTPIGGAEVTGLPNATYANKAYKPQPTVTLDGKTLVAGTDYKLGYQNNKNAGTAKVLVIGIGDYAGTAVGTFKIAKAAQKMTAKASTKKVKYAKVKKSKQTVSGAIKVKKPVGKVTYAKAGGSAKLSINKKTGKITVKKGTKKGTYKIKVKVKASGSRNYKAKTVKVTVKITVK